MKKFFLSVILIFSLFSVSADERDYDIYLYRRKETFSVLHSMFGVIARDDVPVYKNQTHEFGEEPIFYLDKNTNKEDREKLSYALETIIRLSKNEGYKIYDERYGFDLFWDEGSSLKIKHAGGPYKGAGGHNVKTAFYFKTKDSSIHFFLTDDTSDLYINISGGGKKSPDIPGAAYRDDNPNRFYDFNTKKKTVRTMDYYSD